MFLEIQGSTTVYPVIMKFVERFTRDYPDARINVNATGSGGGIAALIDGTADIAMSSRPLSAEEKKIAAQKGLTIEQHLLCRDGIAVVVNPENPISEISITQLCEIFTGKIYDWAELGGDPEMIIPISRDISSGTFVIFNEKILKNEELRADIQLIPSNRLVVQALANTNKGAIGYVGLGYVDMTIKALAVDGYYPHPAVIRSGKYPLTRDLFIFTRGENSKAEELFLKLIFNSEGQEIVKNEGFIPLE